MYQALGNRLIVKKPSERKTSSGILLGEEGNSAVFEFEVIAAPEDSKRFIGKTIVAERRHVIEIGSEKGDRIGALKVEEILAVKD